MSDTELLRRLTDDWERWVRSRRGKAERARWADQYPTVRAWTAPQLAAPPGGPDTDALQAALVALAQDGDEGAVRTLVVQFRPALARLSGRSRGPDRGAGAVVATFVEVVLAHDLSRRPRRIAANLVLDTRQRLNRSRPRPTAASGEDRWVRSAGGDDHWTNRAADRRGRPHREELADRRARPEDVVGGREVVEALAATLARLPGSADSVALTREMAFRAWFLDEPTSRIADDLGLGREAVRTRLSRLRSAVRRHPALAPAA